MRISELKIALGNIQRKYGDLDVCAIDTERDELKAISSVSVVQSIVYLSIREDGF